MTALSICVISNHIVLQYITSNNDQHNHSREEDEEIPDWKKNELKVELTSILHQVISITTTSATSDDKEEEDKQNELPSLLTTNIEMILNVISIPDLLEEIITDEINQQLADGEEKAEEISNAINTILTFTETFVEQTASIEDTYKQVLNKIFTSIAPSVGGLTANTSDKKTISIMENELDILLKSESVSFTPGFLRHVEGECIRISNLKTPSSESTKMLQILRVIQTRILEELGKNIGEGAVVLGQLLGYDNVNEQLAVLDAGLAVRGIEFARELSELTKEALDGFETVKKQQGEDGVDPELIKSVKLIDERIRSFIDKEEKKAKAFQ